MIRLLPLVAVACCLAAVALPAVAQTVPPEPQMLNTLRFGHPRVMLLPQDVERIKASIADNATARSYYEALQKDGAKMLQEPPAERVIPDGKRLLETSRRVLDRVMTLSLLYQLDRNPKWAARARDEMIHVAGYSDWNPSHFLDVAEMTHAMAIGYDWTFDALSPDERRIIRQAIVEKGLRRGEEAYKGTQPWKWWVSVTHNWNIVCNGGMICGALAVADEEPELARFIVSSAVESLPRALASYAPDGAWNEGPAYWGYATKYLVVAFESLRTGLGTDFGLSEMPGLREAGLFRVHSVGPTGLYFNFADAGERAGADASLFYLSRRYNVPLLAQKQRESLAGKSAGERDLLWFDPREVTQQPSLDARYSPAHVAFARSSWTDPNALFVGFKGGDNKANHSHLDLGSFVFDALGERWATDLGGDDYNIPDYFGKLRWTYYRTTNQGHNTLTLDGQNQDPKAVAPLLAFASRPDEALAVADLTQAYKPSGGVRLHRGLSLTSGRRALLVQDEIETQTPVEVAWAMHTHAKIATEGPRATLSLHGKTLHARIIEPEGARFEVVTPETTPPQKPLNDVRKLMVRLPEKTAKTRIVVWMSPDEGLAAPQVRALDEWK